MTQSRLLTMTKRNEAKPERTKSKWVTRRLYDERLHAMLQFKRPHNTLTEARWAKSLLEPYDAALIDDNAWVVTVPRPDGTLNRVMFSSHVDTVHRTEGRQSVWFDPKAECYFKDDDEPLGADDAAGVWLMLEMIDAKVPGTYLFHRGEEKGGLGSSALADEHAKWLEGFDMAIAFDRRGTYDVITHQGWGRCCSDEFANALSDALNVEDMMYTPSDEGVFTDTANYTGLIAECTNLSCGYDMEHTGWETLYLPHLFALRDALVKVDWEALPVKRDPSVDEIDDRFENWRSQIGGTKYAAHYEPQLEDMEYDELLEYCYNSPDEFVDKVWTELLCRRSPHARIGTHNIGWDDDDDSLASIDWSRPH